MEMVSVNSAKGDWKEFKRDLEDDQESLGKQNLGTAHTEMWRNAHWDSSVAALKLNTCENVGGVAGDYNTARG